MARKNPATIKGTLKSASIPKGKKAGDTFMRSGKKYRVVSYTTKSNKRVRYAQAVTKCAAPAKKNTCKTRITAKKKATKKNPAKAAPASLCGKPNRHKRWGAGHVYVDNRGEVCVVQRVGKKKPGKKRKLMALAHTGITKPSVTGRKIGDKFQFNYERYIVAKRKTPQGGYKKYAKKLS